MGKGIRKNVFAIDRDTARVIRTFKLKKINNKTLNLSQGKIYRIIKRRFLKVDRSYFIR